MGATKLTEMQVIKVLRISKPFNVPKTQLDTLHKQNTKWMILSLAGTSHVKSLYYKIYYKNFMIKIFQNNLFLFFQW